MMEQRRKDLFVAILLIAFTIIIGALLSFAFNYYFPNTQMVENPPNTVPLEKRFMNDTDVSVVIL